MPPSFSVPTMAENHRLLSDISGERPSKESCDHNGPSEKDSIRHKLPFLTPRVQRVTDKIGIWAFVLTLLVLLSVLTAGAYHLGTKSSYRPLPEPTNLGSCGATPEEGRNKGCVYDFILGAWIHPECMDHAMYQQYILEWKTLNMTVFSDPEGLKADGLEYAMEGDYEFIWAIGTFHYLHCAYVMEKNWKLLTHQIHAVPSNAVEEEHMYHCLNITGKPSVPDLTDYSVRQIFERAPILDCLVYH